MAINVVYESSGQQYVLRASGPMPVYGDGGASVPRYVLHTFGAELSDIDTYECTDSLLSSDEFRGQGGDLMNASFSRLGDRSGEVFQGRAIHSPDFINEEALGFNFP